MQLLIERLLSRVGKVLISVGDLLNQNLNEQEKKKSKKTFSNPNPFELKEKVNNFNKKIKTKIPKEVFSHKGSGYKGKGKINTGSTTFNRARKDLPAGRES